MGGRLDGKIALVTGAASGIGRATVEAFLHEGARVAATDLAAPAVLASEDSMLSLAHDVTGEAAWASAVAATADHFGGFDVLVNNAGISGAEGVRTTDLAAWRRIMAVNLEGVFLGTRAAIAAMTDNPRPFAGSIVNVSSVLGLVGSQTAVA